MSTTATGSLRDSKYKEFPFLNLTHFFFIKMAFESNSTLSLNFLSSSILLFNFQYSLMFDFSLETETDSGA